MASREEELEQKFFLLVEKLNRVNSEIQSTTKELREERERRALDRLDDVAPDNAAPDGKEQAQ